MKQHFTTTSLMYFALLCTTRGAPLEVSTKLRGCELTFSWTGGSTKSYDVVIDKNKVKGKWKKTNDRYYTVADAFKYYSIKIEVRNEGIGNGRVLEYIVQPLIPVITGNLDILVGSYAELTCTIPDCSKQGPLSYAWFVNGEKIEKQNRETLRFNVTNDLKYKKYTCTVNGNEIKFNRSHPVQINPQFISGILVLTLATVLILYFVKRRKTGKDQESVKVEAAVEESLHPEHPTSALYATVDNALKRKYNIDDVVNTEEDLDNKKESRLALNSFGKEEREKEDHDDKKVEGNANPLVETNNVKQEGLIYIEVDFAKKPGSTDPNVQPTIRGQEDPTEYSFVDFSKKAPPEQDKPENVEQK
uniref:Uncharacterized protein LOC111112455 isoform X2 n=1 Tax=Crassostrea virginica TaxID=6565 RepID=A0A8B8BS42_CRAVI|nr:uncharacterized protein LOC111112455 isoform X2 [Crassostrea virginica]